MQLAGHLRGISCKRGTYCDSRRRPHLLLQFRASMQVDQGNMILAAQDFRHTVQKDGVSVCCRFYLMFGENFLNCIRPGYDVHVDSGQSIDNFRKTSDMSWWEDQWCQRLPSLQTVYGCKEWEATGRSDEGIIVCEVFSIPNISTVVILGRGVCHGHYIGHWEDFAYYWK